MPTKATIAFDLIANTAALRPAMQAASGDIRSFGQQAGQAIRGIGGGIRAGATIASSAVYSGGLLPAVAGGAMRLRDTRINGMPEAAPGARPGGGGGGGWNAEAGMLRGVGGVLSQMGSYAGGPAAGLAGLAGSALSLAASPAGIAVGSIGLIAGAYKVTQDFAYAARDLRVESSKLGVGVVYFQQLQLAARRTGTDIGTLEMGIERMRVNRDKALADPLSSEAISFRNALGVTQEQLAGMSVEELAKRGGDIKSAGAAAHIFGRSGPMLVEGLKESQKIDPLALTPYENKAVEAGKIDIRFADRVRKAWAEFRAKIQDEQISRKAEEDVWRQASPKMSSNPAGGYARDPVYIKAMSDAAAAGPAAVAAAHKQADDDEAAELRRKNLDNQAPYREQGAKRSEGLYTPEEIYNRTRASDQTAIFAENPKRQAEMMHRAAASASNALIEANRELKSPGERLKETLEQIGKNTYSSDPQKNLMYQARAAATAQQEAMASMRPTGPAGAYDIDSAEGYNQVMQLQYERQVKQAMRTQTDPFLSLLPAAVRALVPGNRGFAQQPIAWDGRQ